MKVDKYHKVSNLTVNGSVHSIQEFFVRQKVKFNAALIEYHRDSGMN